MVHALEQIHVLLEPGGYLIDIHPSGELVEFILLLDEQEHFIGYMQETDDYIEYHQASEAIETVVRNGLFRIENTTEFDFYDYADSFGELKDHLDNNWSDAVITDDVITQAHKLEKEFGQRKVFLREQVKINLLAVNS